MPHTRLRPSPPTDPDNSRATKLVVGILRRAGQNDPKQMRTWSTDAGDVRNDPLIAAEVADWLHSQGIKETLDYGRIIGCPHEEGIDYPMGRSCPRCPFWAGIDRFTHEPIPAPVAPRIRPGSNGRWPRTSGLTSIKSSTLMSCPSATPLGAPAVLSPWS